MRPTIELGQQLQAGLKTSELKLSDLIQTDQFNLRGLLGGQPTVTTTTLGTPGIQQITIGLPTSNTPTSQATSLLDPEILKQLQSPSQMVSLSQLQALLSILAGNKPIVQTPKEISNLNDILTSQMLLQGNPSLVSGGVGGISLPLEGLTSNTLNSPTTTGITLTGNTLKGFPFSAGGREYTLEKLKLIYAHVSSIAQIRIANLAFIGLIDFVEHTQCALGYACH